MLEKRELSILSLYICAKIELKFFYLHTEFFFSLLTLHEKNGSRSTFLVKLGLTLSFLCQICFELIDGAVLARSLFMIFWLLAGTSPSINSKQIWHKKGKVSPNDLSVPLA